MAPELRAAPRVSGSPDEGPWNTHGPKLGVLRKLLLLGGLLVIIIVHSVYPKNPIPVIESPVLCDSRPGQNYLRFPLSPALPSRPSGQDPAQRAFFTNSNSKETPKEADLVCDASNASQLASVGEQVLL